MKISIARQDLQDAVNKVKSVVSSKSALPILSHILMEASDNTLKLSATDLKVSIESTVDCDVAESGSMTISEHLSGTLPRQVAVVAVHKFCHPNLSGL